MIYFDNASTTYPKPESVYKALDYANRNLAFNAGRGLYPTASNALSAIEEAREAVASLVKRPKEDVTFLSGATEALDLIINGLDFNDGDCVYISPFEHNAIVRPLYELQKRVNIEILTLPFSKETYLPEIDKIESMMSFKKPKAVFLSQVSNVIGLQIDYLPIFDIAKKYNAYTILDSAQALGVVNPDLRNTDFCVFSGHKTLYSSFGVGGFISSKAGDLSVIKSGGNGSDTFNHYMPKSGHEHIEAGSENVVAIYGLVESVKWLKENDVLSHEQSLAEYFMKQIENNKKIHIYRKGDVKNYTGIVSINVDGYLSTEVGSILSDEYDICVRTGYHCAPFIHDFIDSLPYQGTVRVSFSTFNTIEEVNALIKALESL